MAPGTGVHPATVDAVRDLTLDLVGALLPGGEEDRNTICSGFGLWCALAVLLAGAGEHTAASLSAALRTDPGQATTELRTLDERLRLLGGASHALAVWSRVPTYAAWRESLPTVAFASLDEPADLDAWVREQTGGLIERLPLSIDPSTLLAIVDAVCLIARWVQPFPVDATRDERFTDARGTSIEVPMMRRSFGPSDGYAIAAAGPNQRTTVMSLFCQASPDDTAGRASSTRRPQAHLRLALGAPELGAMAVLHDLMDAPLTQVHADRVDLRLPRFAIRSHHDLREPLDAMGLGGLFEETADLSGLSPEPLMISSAVQEAVLDVDEEGVKAAAVTSFALRAGAMMAPDPVVIDLAFDRPFAYALVDPDLDLPLFAGWVADPRSVPSASPLPEGDPPQ